MLKKDTTKMDYLTSDSFNDRFNDPGTGYKTIKPYSVHYPIFLNTLIEYLRDDIDVNNFHRCDEIFITGDNFPKIDVWKEDEKYFVSAVIAGIPKKDVKIEIDEKRQLIFSYDKKYDDSRNYIRKELTTKSFKKKIMLPEYVDTNSYEVKCEDGVVTLSFNFLPERKPIIISLE